MALESDVKMTNYVEKNEWIVFAVMLTIISVLTVFDDSASILSFVIMAFSLCFLLFEKNILRSEKVCNKEIGIESHEYYINILNIKRYQLLIIFSVVFFGIRMIARLGYLNINFNSVAALVMITAIIFFIFWPEMLKYSEHFLDGNRLISYEKLEKDLIFSINISGAVLSSITIGIFLAILVSIQLANPIQSIIAYIIIVTVVCLSYAISLKETIKNIFKVLNTISYSQKTNNHRYYRCEFSI